MGQRKKNTTGSMEESPGIKFGDMVSLQFFR